jgi:hypothetical protein
MITASNRDIDGSNVRHISSKRSVKSKPPRHDDGTVGPKERSASMQFEVSEVISGRKREPEACCQK